MPEPSHADILAAINALSTKVDRNVDRIEIIESQTSEYRGALKLGKWLVWLLMGLGGSVLAFLELFKHAKS